MLLYRPVGLEELLLVYDAEMRAFPPRLPDQPIFYPVTNEGYAKQIARDWNTKSGTLGGFVTRFVVDDGYASKFERRVVGAREHEELWVPAEELPDFNGRLDGRIEVIGAFFGDGYVGLVPDAFGLKGMHAEEQFLVLARQLSCKSDVGGEVASNPRAIFANFFFWEQHDFSAGGFGDAARTVVLDEVKGAWASRGHPPVPLGVQRA